MIEERAFEAEARQVLQLMVHAVYPKPEVFLRELISNASDALDRLHLEHLVGGAGRADDPHIRIEIDPEAGTLSVSDNGIGMTREEVTGLIGTVARSGSDELRRRLEERPVDLIGKFGVGFYSSFMVADRVRLVTRRAGASEGTRWESRGTSTYTLSPAPDAPPGTTVVLHLTERAREYASELRVRALVRQYSDFIRYPIRLASEATGETVTLNSMKAIWAQPRAQVSDDAYHDFYQHLTHDFEPPLEIITYRAEGAVELQALLFIPSRLAHDLFSKDGRHGVQLYVRNVFLMADCPGLMPAYLRWVTGVVNAEDLALNLSREQLQQDRQVQLIRRQLVRKVLSTLREMRDEKPERYAELWTQCGARLKEGLRESPDDRETLLELCRFASTASDDTTLAEYRARMKDGQDAIYYVTAPTRPVAEGVPHQEGFRSRGIEVLLLTDPVDVIWTAGLRTFRGVRLQSITQDAGGSGTASGCEDLFEYLRARFADEVKDVRASSLLMDSAACIVGSPGDITPQLERMARVTGQPVPRVKRILEVNPGHPLILDLQQALRRGDAELERGADLLYGAAVLAGGGELRSPSDFARRLVDVAGRLLRAPGPEPPASR